MTDEEASALWLAAKSKVFFFWLILACLFFFFRSPVRGVSRGTHIIQRLLSSFCTSVNATRREGNEHKSRTSWPHNKRMCCAEKAENNSIGLRALVSCVCFASWRTRVDNYLFFFLAFLFFLPFVFPSRSCGVYCLFSLSLDDVFHSLLPQLLKMRLRLFSI